MNIKSVLESLMFAWGEPLSINEISKILDMPAHGIINVLDEMISEVSNNKDRGLIIQRFGSSYQLTTKKKTMNIFKDFWKAQ